MSQLDWDTATLAAAVSEREAELKIRKAYGNRLTLRQRLLARLLGV